MENLEISRTRLTMHYLAEHLEIDDAVRFLKSLKETTMFLERRISREKSIIAAEAQTVLKSEAAGLPSRWILERRIETEVA